MLEVFSGQGMEEMGINLKDMLSNVMPTRTKRRRVPVAEARRLLAQEEAQKLVDMDEVVSQAVRRVENSGIIFLDELDKVAGPGGRPRARRLPGGRAARPPADRRGLRRSPPSTASVRTDHILFIAAGRLPRRQALRPDPRAAGPLPHPGRAGALDAGGFRPHPDRAPRTP